MREPVLVDAVRTPIGRQGGALKDVRPDRLYATVLDALASRHRVVPDDVITGCVTQAGEQGANVGRQAVLLSSLPMTVPATTLTRMCGSSQQAVHFAAQAIAAGDARIVIAGGVESMTRAPMFSDIRGGFDTLNPDLRAKYEIVHQGESAERVAAKYGITRRELDEWSAESHRRAGRAKPKVVPVAGLDRDEGVRPQPNLEKMAALAPVFRKDGVITAANSSQISDGAAAVLVADREAGLPARARFRARVAVAGDPTMQLLEVIPATREALKRAGLRIEDVDVVEINEAFASVVLAWMREFRPDPARVNPDGGAIAHGHPLGATGAVLMCKLLDGLEARGGRFGLQVMCIGHGMATATVIERTP